jgi:hypothetical protein
MPNEFVARNGIIALNNSSITGSLGVSSGITGSLFGTASWASNAVTSSYILNAVSASFASTASFVQNAVSSSFALTASFVQNAISASFASTASFVNPLRQDVQITGSLFVSSSNATQLQVGTSVLPYLFVSSSGAVQTTYQTTLATSIPDNVRVGTSVDSTTSPLYKLDVNGTVRSLGLFMTSSITNPGTSQLLSTSVTGSFTVITGSVIEFQVTNTGVRIGNATTDTHSVTGSLNVSGSITTTGTITAQTLVVQTITSSTDFVTGSTRFGSLLANTHQFTGSVSMTGSLTTNGNTIVSGSLTVATSSNQGGVQLYSNSSVGGGIRFSHTNGSVIGRIELNAGGGTSGLDLYAYDYFNFKTLNTAINFITTTTANWYTYGGNKFNFVGYTGFGGEVIMKNNLDGTEVFHAYLADTYKVAFPTGSISIGKPAATTPNATLDVSGSVTITGSLTVFTGSAIEFQVTTTGTKIGNAITDAHTVTGSLNISGSVTATNFTGSLFGTSSWAVSASWAPGGGGGAAFPYTGSALITGSLIVTGSTTFTSSYAVDINGSMRIQAGPLRVEGTNTSAGDTAQGLIAPLKFKSVSSNYTLINPDESKVILANSSGGNITITVPCSVTHSYAKGTELTIINTGTNSVIITGSAISCGLSTPNVKSAGGLKTLSSQYAAASLLYESGEGWYLFGNLT